MKILYIAFDNPAVETILGGMRDETLSGLPAFYYPLKMLLEQGHTVDMLLWSSLDHSVVESKYFKKENLIQIKPKHDGILGMLELPLRLSRETRKLLKARHYDFVYGMAEGSHMAVRTAAKWMCHVHCASSARRRWRMYLKRSPRAYAAGSKRSRTIHTSRFR